MATSWCSYCQNILIDNIHMYNGYKYCSEFCINRMKEVEQLEKTLTGKDKSTEGKPVQFVAVVIGMEYNLSGAWGTFSNEEELKKFMESRDMPRETYDIFILNHP